MTLIVGYIYKNTPQIIADSAITIHSAYKEKFGMRDEKTTSFGEAVYSGDEEIVESGQKLYALTKTVLAAFSGQVMEGRMVLEDLHNILKLRNDKPKTDLLLEYIEQRKPTESEYIFGLLENIARCRVSQFVLLW